MRDSIFLVLVILGAILGSTSHSKWLWSIAAILFLLAALVRFSSRIARIVLERRTAGIKERMLPEIKNDLENSLRQLQKPLLVVIDDIDRLNAIEIREVIQLVKANANLPNIIYLLLFERGIVESALDEVTAKHGREFLEKVVQVPFDVPSIEVQKLSRIFRSKIDQLVIATRTPFDHQRWADLNSRGLMGRFGSLRDVYRFSSTLAFHLNLFLGPIFEVNCVDLIGLETLRVFDPEVYRLIRENKRYLTWDKQPLPKPEPNPKQLFDDLLSAGGEKPRPQLRDLLLELFPTLRPAVEGANISSDEQLAWSRDLRLCAPDYFARYFLFRSPEDDISEAKFQQILKKTGDKEELSREFHDLSEVNLLWTLVERLSLRSDQLNKGDSGILMAAFFDAERELSPKPGTASDAHSLLNAVALVRQILFGVEDKGARSDSLVQALDLSSGLFFPMHILYYQTDDATASLLLPRDLTNLREMWMRKVVAAARTGTIFEGIGVPDVIEQWRLANPTECGQWMEDKIKERSTLYSILGVYTERITVLSGDRVSYSYTFNLQKLKKIIPVDVLEIQLRMHHFDPVTDEEKRVRALVKETLKR